MPYPLIFQVIYFSNSIILNSSRVLISPEAYFFSNTSHSLDGYSPSNAKLAKTPAVMAIKANIVKAIALQDLSGIIRLIKQIVHASLATTGFSLTVFLKKFDDHRLNSRNFLRFFSISRKVANTLTRSILGRWLLHCLAIWFRFTPSAKALLRFERQQLAPAVAMFRHRLAVMRLSANRALAPAGANR